MTKPTQSSYYWWLTIVLTFCALFMPQQAVAGNYVDEGIHFQVMLNGANTIRIKVPVYNEKADDHWVCNGNLTVQVADDKGNYGDSQTILWWREDESKNGHDNDESDLWCKFKTGVAGSLDVTQGNSSKHFTLTKADGEQRRLVYENSDGRTYDIIAIWRLPYELLGKTLKFSWNVKCDYTNGLAWNTEYAVTGLSSAAGDMVALFSGDECRGITTLPATDITVYALTEGEALTLKYYDAANKRILTFNNPIKKR